VQLVDAGEHAAGGRPVSEELEYVDKPERHKGKPFDLGFRQMPAHAQTRYATALEKASIKDHEPVFGEVAMNEWAKSVQEWLKFGTYNFPAFNDPKLMIRLDDVTNLKLVAAMTDNARYWTERWSNDTNYRYWKEHAEAEGERQGVECRKLFYEGTLALRNGDYPLSADRYKRGLDLWKDLLDRHAVYRDDVLNQKDTGAILRRYVHVLRNLGEPIPKDMPFQEIYKMVQNQPPPPDPFDALDMIRARKSGPQAAPAPPQQ
jgi:hypothetical protein